MQSSGLCSLNESHAAAPGQVILDNDACWFSITRISRFTPYTCFANNRRDVLDKSALYRLDRSPVECGFIQHVYLFQQDRSPMASLIVSKLYALAESGQVQARNSLL